jgi:hypothetical protein
VKPITSKDQARRAEAWLAEQDRRRAEKKLPVDPRYDHVIHVLVVYDWTGGPAVDPVSQPKRAEAWLKDQARRRDAGEPLDPRYDVVLGAWLIDDWQDGPPLSRHLDRELDAMDAGRTLETGAPVPRCGCYLCTGISEAPTRIDRIDRSRTRRRPRRDPRPALDVDRARAVPIMDVAAMLGIEHKRGWAVCPFHADSSPSLHLNPKKQAAFCNPCGKSWDAIALVMDYRNLTFPEAVKELAA